MSRRQVGSVRQLDKGVYRVEVTAGRDPVTGARLRFSRTIRGTRHEAETELARLLLDAGSRPSARMTVRQYITDVWLPSLRVRRLTKLGYESKLDHHVLPQLGSVRLCDLKAYQLDRWMRELADSGISKRTQLHAYRVLCSALNRAVLWGMIATNPLKAIAPPVVPRKVPDVLSLEEANDYLDAFAGHPLEAVVTITIAAGLRRSELAGLMWSDLDRKTGAVNIARGRHQLRSEVWDEDPKSETSKRVVTLPHWAVETLKPLHGLGPIASVNGLRMTPNQMTDHYRRRVAKMKLRYVPLKNLRHTSATLALAANVNIVAVSRRLGHSSIAVTDAFYLAPGRAADADAAQKMDSIRRQEKPATVHELSS